MVDNYYLVKFKVLFKNQEYGIEMSCFNILELMFLQLKNSTMIMILLSAELYSVQMRFYHFIMFWSIIDCVRLERKFYFIICFNVIKVEKNEIIYYWSNESEAICNIVCRW